MNKIIPFLIALQLPMPAYSEPNPFVQPEAAACVQYTEQVMGTPRGLLLAVHDIEAGRPGTVSRRNKNGTYDMGPMQFNTSTAADLKKYGFQNEHILNSECASIYAAGWKLATSAHQFNNWELAIAAYNCGDRCVGDAIKKLRKTNTTFNNIHQLDIPPKTKTEYVPIVMTAWRRYACQAQPTTCN